MLNCISQQLVWSYQRGTGKQYVTIHGFSFARSYVELYKQSIKQQLQKMWALRSKLSDSNKKKQKKAVAAAASAASED